MFALIDSEKFDPEFLEVMKSLAEVWEVDVETLMEGWCIWGLARFQSHFDLYDEADKDFPLIVRGLTALPSRKLFFLLCNREYKHAQKAKQRDEVHARLMEVAEQVMEDMPIEEARKVWEGAIKDLRAGKEVE